MKLNQVEFEKGCAKFRGRYRDFKSFEEPGYQYLQDERLYKLELIELYKRRVRPLLSKDSEEFFRAYIEILRSKLAPIGRSQTLISFHPIARLNRLPREERVKFGKLLQDVLRQSQSIDDVADSLVAYTEGASSIRTSDNKSLSASTMRAFVSLLLMLDKPDTFIYFTFTYWQKVGRLLVGNQLIDYGVPISKKEFLTCNEFKTQVQHALDVAGFRPKDMVDVQSFFIHHH